MRTTLLEAAVIVVVVIFLFLGNLRSTLIPIVTIPLSLIGVMFALLALGYSINLLTLLALVLAIGLVVDDAIVVVENIHRHIEEGMQPFDAALTGAREIAVPVISMTITLAAVYAPIGFVSGLTGALFREFAFTLAGAVIVSGIIALTLSPMMASLLLKPHTSSGRFNRFLDRMFDSVRRRYERRLSPHAQLSAGDAADRGRRDGRGRHHVRHQPEGAGARGGPGHPVQHRQGAADRQPRLSRADDRRAQQGVRHGAEKEHVFLINGMGGDVRMAIAGILFKPWEERKRTQKQILESLQPKLGGIAGGLAISFPLPSLPGAAGGGPPVQFVVQTTADYQQLSQVLAELQAEATKSGLFIFTDTDLKFQTPQVELKIDHDKANSLGVKMSDIGGSLATLLGGNYVNRFNLYGRSYQVIPQVPRDFRLTPEWLKRYQVRTTTGALVPLSSVATVAESVQPNALTSFQQLNSATLQGVPFPGRTIGEAVDFLKTTAAQKLPEGFSYDFQGESRQYVQEGGTLVVTFIFALIIIYLVLAAQYESFRDPLIILIALPTAIFGALIPINLGLASINIYTQVGLVTLIGLISKHGILMVDYANHLQENEGLVPARGHRAGRRHPPAPDPDDDRGHGGRHGAAADRQRRRRGQPLLDRPGDRRRHDHRHDLYAVRDTGRLYLRRPRASVADGAAPGRRWCAACQRPGREASAERLWPHR